MNDEGTNAALSRGLAILQAVSLSKGPVRFSALKALMPDVPDSTLTRVLRSLEASGHVRKDGKSGYAMGPHTLRWLAATRQHPGSVSSAAAEQVDVLTSAGHESAAVAMLEGATIRILKSKSLPDAISILPEGGVLHFESDHAASIAILDQLNASQRAASLKSPFSRIAGLAEYRTASAAMRHKDGVWLDRSRARPGICRMAVGFLREGIPGAVFFCLTVESARAREADLSRLLQQSRDALAG